MSEMKKPLDQLRKVDSVGVGQVQPSKLKQDFNIYSTLGIAFSFIATPLAVGTYLAFSRSAGGSPYFFYGYVTVFFLNTLVALSLAEMAAFLPHTSGQIFWTAKLAPASYARALSYFNGGFTMMAWIFWTAGTFLFAAQLLFAFIGLFGVDWVQKGYQEFLVYVAFAAVALFLNTWGFRFLLVLSKFMIGVINIGSIFVLVALLVRANPKPSAREVFVDVVNQTGWQSNGLVFFISLLPGVTAINGFDSAAHLAEELPHPAKQVPQVMIGTVLLCGFAGLPMVVAFLFSVVKPENLLTAPQPVIQLFYDSLDSMPLYVICVMIYLLTYLFACGSILTTASRCWWSFMRSDALPFPRWQDRVSNKLTLPVNSIMVVFLVCVVIGLLIFGPATVLSGIVGSAAICFYISYTMPIVCLLIKGRKNLPAKRYFNLGRLGPIINWVSVVWAFVISVFLCFPTSIPVAASLMNYASAVVVVGVMFWALMWVFYARKHYKIPDPLFAEELHGSYAISGESPRHVDDMPCHQMM